MRFPFVQDFFMRFIFLYSIKHFECVLFAVSELYNLVTNTLVYLRFFYYTEFPPYSTL